MTINSNITKFKIERLLQFIIDDKNFIPKLEFIPDLDIGSNDNNIVNLRTISENIKIR